MIQWMLAIWSLVPLPFLNPAWTSRSSQFTYCLLKPNLENFEHYFASMWNECNCVVVCTFFGIALIWDWNDKWLCPVLWPLLSLLAYWLQQWIESEQTPGDSEGQEAWRAAVHGIAESQTRLSEWTATAGQGGTVSPCCEKLSPPGRVCRAV